MIYTFNAVKNIIEKYSLCPIISYMKKNLEMGNKFIEKYRLDNPLYNLIHKLELPGVAFAAFFISGVPATLVLDAQKGTTIAFVFAFIAALVARNEYKKYENAYEEFLKENKDAWD
jgi:hypothetical protein